MCSSTACLSVDVNPYGAGDPKNLDEDEFTVWYLQSMNVVTSPSIDRVAPGGVGAGAGHSLTLDGQSDTDYYAVYTTGSHGSVRNYAINVLDTGASDNGVDELAIYGIDNTDPFFNGYVTGTTTRNADGRHLPAAGHEVHRHRDAVRRQLDRRGVPTHLREPTEKADRPAFVALLGGNIEPGRRRRPLPRPRPVATSRRTRSSGSTTTPRSTAG